MRERKRTQGTAEAIDRAAKLPLFVGLALLALAWPGTGMALAAFPGHNGQIAFQSDREAKRHGNAQIYTMNADGACQARLTDSPAFDGFPAWSPSGRRIAFTSNRDGNFEIYVMRADGLDQRRLTDNPASDAGPAWSPDGRRIVFRSDRDGDSEIYVMNADGSDQRRLTHSPGFDGAPSWSPNGRRIAFRSDRDSHTGGEEESHGEIYVMNADGSAQTRLTDTDAESAAPDWSPDGRRIAFDSKRDGFGQVYAMNADGSEQTRLTDNTMPSGGPSWSPDGEKIAFRSFLGSRGNEINVMNVDGADVIGLRSPGARVRWQSLPLPSNRFCLGKLRRNKERGFVRQRIRVPGPGTAIVRRSKRVRRFAREIDESGVVGVLIRPRGPAERRLDRAGTVQRRMEVNLRAQVGFRPDGGRRRTEQIRVRLVKVGRR